MLERILRERPLPDIVPGEVLLRTPNLRVVTDFKPGLEDLKEGARFYIEPTNSKGDEMLLWAAEAHNNFNFELRPVAPHYIKGEFFVYPCLRIGYKVENLPALFDGAVIIPEPGQHSVPPPIRIEACIERNNYGDYTFSDDLPSDYAIQNPSTRRLKLIQVTHLDEVPDRILHSHDSNPNYKVRKYWWIHLFAKLGMGVKSGEFTDPGILEEIRKFSEKYNNREFTSSQHLTTAEHIADANRIIDIIWNRYGSPDP